MGSPRRISRSSPLANAAMKPGLSCRFVPIVAMPARAVSRVASSSTNRLFICVALRCPYELLELRDERFQVLESDNYPSCDLIAKFRHRPHLLNVRKTSAHVLD